MRKILFTTLVLLSFTLTSTAFAANRYWVGGTGNWDGTAGSKWATSTGGAGGSAVPGLGDDVFFDGNSTGTITAAPAVQVFAHNLNFTGFTNTFTESGAGGSFIQISGSLTAVNTATTTLRALTFNATSTGQTITTAGNVITTISFNGVGGGWTLQDNLSTATGAGALGITLSNGSVDFNGKNVVTLRLSSNNANTRSLTMGTGTIAIGGTGSAPPRWDITNPAGMTLSATSSTINFFMSGNDTFNGGGLTYGTLMIQPSAVATTTITGSNTFGTLQLNSASSSFAAAFATGTTQTVSTFTAIGSSGKVITIKSNSIGIPATLSKSSGSVGASWVSIRDSTATGGASWSADCNSTNVSGNSGWVFGTPPAGSCQGVTGIFKIGKTVFKGGNTTIKQR